MKIERFALGSLGTNSYLIINEETKEILIVDPATCPDYVVSHVKSNGYIPKAVLLTHAHFDHVMGINRWVEEFGIPVYLHEEEKEILEKVNLNLSYQFGKNYAYEGAECFTSDEMVQMAGFEFRVIHTPGHTKGGCCYYFESEEVLFSGDTLFAQSVGRSDFPTGNMRVLINSIKEKLFCLPDTVMVYPGHNDLTCIADEKAYNPFIR